MDINDLRSLITVLGLLCFLGICYWAYSKHAKAGFDEAAAHFREFRDRAVRGFLVVRERADFRDDVHEGGIEGIFDEAGTAHAEFPARRGEMGRRTHGREESIDLFEERSGGADPVG